MLRDNELYHNHKRQFAQEKFEYLGHLISGQRVDVDRVMLERQVSTSIKDVRGFFGTH